jgi:hypothetical protein
MVIKVGEGSAEPEGEDGGLGRGWGDARVREGLGAVPGLCASASTLLFPVVPEPIRFFPYALSAGLHAVCVGLSILIAGVIPPAEPPAVEYRAKALMIRLPTPDQIIKPRAEREPEQAADRAGTLRELADNLIVSLREGKVQALTNPGPAVKTADRPAQVEAVLIQPQFPLDMRPPPMSPMVPSVLLWPTQLPAAPLEPVVVRAQPVAAARLSIPKFAMPEVVRPNVNPSTRDLSAPPVIEQGPAVALLSISTAPMVRDTIVVPPGNLIPAATPAKPTLTQPNGADGDGPVFDAPAVGGTVKSASAVAPGRTTPDRTTPDRTTPSQAAVGQPMAAPRPRTTPSVPAAVENEKRSRGLTNGAAIGVIERAANSVPAAVKGGSTGIHKDPALPVAAIGIIEPAVTSAPADRMEHPVNGLFDVVIVQTTLDESIPGSGNLLQGRPIYTVYLQVGDTKDWILHYCVKDGAPVQRGAVFQLPDPRPVKAPYPRFTFRPAEPVTGPEAYVLVHGLIDEAGILQNLKVIGPVQSGASSLLAALGRWRFRPATRGEEPEPVEMVLAIPMRKS